MPDREKYIEILSKAAKTVKEFNEDTPIKISLECIEDILELLKEQEDLGTELTNAVELIHKKNERIEKLLKEQETANLYKCPNCGTWVSAENVVRCKDCKHRPIKPADYENGFDLQFPDNECIAQCDDGWYSWYPHDNWYCWRAERKDET